LSHYSYLADVDKESLSDILEFWREKQENSRIRRGAISSLSLTFKFLLTNYSRYAVEKIQSIHILDLTEINGIQASPFKGNHPMKISLP
jgi:hypothetical protein